MANSTISTTPDKVAALESLSKLSAETLRILADLSKKEGIEKTLKEKVGMIKLFL